VKETYPNLRVNNSVQPVEGPAGAPLHCRVVDAKYSTIELSADGHLVGKPEYAAQLRDCNEALGRLQGFTPPPMRVTASEALWWVPAPAEFYVDFETSLDLNDDFSTFPAKGATPLIYMVGCGWLEDPLDTGSWRFRSFTTDRLTEAEEARILDAWIGFMHGFCAARGNTLDEARLFHWSSAEPSFLDTQYNSPVERHGREDCAGLPWVDLLQRVFKAEPILVGGTAGYGLKEIARALHAEGILSTLWDDGLGGVDGGMAAMAGAWWADAEAAKTGGSMRDFDAVQAIERYNEIDLRVMAEILAWLRRER